MCKQDTILIVDRPIQAGPQQPPLRCLTPFTFWPSVCFKDHFTRMRFLSSSSSFIFFTLNPAFSNSFVITSSTERSRNLYSDTRKPNSSSNLDRRIRCFFYMSAMALKKSKVHLLSFEGHIQESRDPSSEERRLEDEG